MRNLNSLSVPVVALLLCALVPAAQAQTVEFIYVSAGGQSGPVPGANDGHIQRMNGNGGGLTTLMAPGTIPGLRTRGIACDEPHGNLYFNEFGGGATTAKTWRLSMAGGAPALVLDHGDFGANDIDVDPAGGRIYIGHSVSFGTFHGVKSFDFSGGAVITEFDVFMNGVPYGSSSDPGWWIDGVDYVPATGQIYAGDPGILAAPGGLNGVQRFDAGGAVTNYVSMVPHLNGRGRGMAVHPGGPNMYFAEHTTVGVGSGQIWTADKLTGAGLGTIATGLDRPRDIALDPYNNEIYWVDEFRGTVEKVSISGGAITTVATGLDAPDSLCLTFLRVGACCTDGPNEQSDCIEVTQDECELAGPDGGLFLGSGTSCDDVEDCVPLAVTMDAMSAERSPDGVVVRWTTALELETVGFRIVRQLPDGREKARQEIVVAHMIPATGYGTAGASYEFVDGARMAVPGVRYFIEDLDIYGRWTRHGPISVERGFRVSDSGGRR